MWIRKSLVTVDILYYMPDYTDIIQEFMWQTNDYAPDLPRVHKFLNFWKSDIDAVIKAFINQSEGDDELNIYGDGEELIFLKKKLSK